MAVSVCPATTLAVPGDEPSLSQGLCVCSCGTVHITIGDGGNNEGLSGLNYNSGSNGAPALAHREPHARSRPVHVHRVMLHTACSCLLPYDHSEVPCSMQ